MGAACSTPPPAPPKEIQAAEPTPAERAAARRSTAPGGDSATRQRPEPGPGRTDSVEALRLQLVAMAGNDQEIRSQIFSKPVNEITPQERDQLAALDRANAARLGEILVAHGWPGKSLVGEQASDAAFLIVQHADADLQRRALPLLEQAYQSGEATGQQLAKLTDRVRLNQGKPQLYGTQVVFSSDGEMTVEPIEDESRLDERRAKLGLSPHAEYLKSLAQAYRMSR